MVVFESTKKKTEKKQSKAKQSKAKQRQLLKLLGAFIMIT
jgi:hypothetical protein